MLKVSTSVLPHDKMTRPRYMDPHKSANDIRPLSEIQGNNVGIDGKKKVVLENERFIVLSNSKEPAVP